MQTLSLGKHNPKLIEIRKAVQHSELTADGLLPIEGPKLLDEAIRSGLTIADIFVRPGIDLRAVPPGTRVYELEASVFKTIQGTETSQGIVALVRPPCFAMRQLLEQRAPLLVVLARLQDSGNVGTILRVAESFSATGCIGLEGTASIHNAKTVRASTGSVFRQPHVWNVKLPQLVSDLREHGIRIVGTAPGAKMTIDSWDWKQPTALMVGNEGGGLNEAEAAACDAVLRIPQNSSVESLNSAIATAVILYEASKHDRLSV